MLKKRLLGTLAMVIVMAFAMTVVGCEKGSTDGIEIKMNNGTFEVAKDGKTLAMQTGTYSGNGKTITVTFEGETKTFIIEQN